MDLLYNKLKKEALEKEFCNLNDMQKQAVFSCVGPSLVLAGAGSGKTTMLINKIAYIMNYGNAYFDEDTHDAINDDDIDFLKKYIDDKFITDEKRDYLKDLISVNPVSAYNIIAITFTNKAAGELKERLEKKVGEESKNIWAMTFHSCCARILRRDIDKIGYNRDFTIYDSDDSLRVMKDCVKTLNLNDKNFPPKAMLSLIGKAKDALIDYKEYKKTFSNDFKLEKVADLYEMYQNKLKQANALDFDDLIMLTVKLLDEEESVRNYYQNKFRYIFVDEYQDTNHAQYKLVSILADKYKNICVVGDDDQSIYKFRGANIENILSFEKHFPGAKVIRLEQNYRSSKNILDAANNIIKNNKERKGKKLWTDNGEGEKITVFESIDESFEAKFIADKIMDLVSRGKQFNDFAVLYRANAQSGSVERALVKSGIAYRIVGGFRFYERKEIKDIISYLWVIYNNNDDLRLKRIINEPKRGIGKQTIDTIEQIANRENMSMYEVIKNAYLYTELSRSVLKLKEFSDMMEWFKKALNEMHLDSFCDMILEKSGYRGVYVLEGTPEAKDRIENLNQFISTLTLYERENEDATLGSFLEEVSLMTDIDNLDPDEKCVTLMTIHAAKGLEFPVVFIVGMEEGVFPGTQAMFEPSQIEEERRLAYVGVTRAKELLYITHARSRILYGSSQYNPVSRFVGEIPREFVEYKSNARKVNPYGASTSYKEKEEVRFLDDEGFIGNENKENDPVSSYKKATQSFVNGTSSKNSGGVSYTIGEMVLHKVFGEGMIVSAQKMGNDTLLEVAFDKVGKKKIMANFAGLKKI